MLLDCNPTMFKASLAPTYSRSEVALHVALRSTDNSYGMPAKRATKPERSQGLTKAEACKALQVAPTADEELITQAYWHQARKVRVLAAKDPEARAELDKLNRAFLVLNPARTEAPLAGDIPQRSHASPLANEFLAWLRRIVDQIKARWPEHVPEVTTLVITIALLTYIALSAGAQPIWTLMVAGAAALAIWAPWRHS